jgi:hypothetical protein
MGYSGFVNRMLPRLFVILALAAAWVVASNHCALASLTPQKGGHACCAGDLPQARETMTSCCEDLAAPLPVGAHVPVGSLHVLFVAWMEPGEWKVSVPVRSVDRFPSHGPPGAMAFAEQVLNRSLLAHAPPFVVS